MSEDELKAHEQWVTSDDGENPWDGVENGARRVLALVAEVRRLKRESAEIATTWIPIAEAQKAARSSADSAVEKLARLIETMTDEHRRAGHSMMGVQVNDTARDRYRAIAAYVRHAWREASR